MDENIKVSNFCLACVVTWFCCPLIGIYAIYTSGKLQDVDTYSSVPLEFNL